MSPAKKLSQGYSYVADQTGRAVTDASKVGISDTLEIYLLRGSLKAEVTDIQEKSDIDWNGESNE